MRVSAIVYSAFLVAVGLGRFVEMYISRRNERRLLARGVAALPDPNFRWTVIFHTGMLFSAGLEVWILRRPFLPLLAVTMAILFFLSNVMRWWIIGTLGDHWNFQVVPSTSLGVVTGGPYRWVRHPNYFAVFTEMIAVPLIHTAWLTAVAGTITHAFLLRSRVNLEDRVLLADPAYRTAMGWKPRFIPNFMAASRPPQEKSSSR